MERKINLDTKMSVKPQKTRIQYKDKTYQMENELQMIGDNVGGDWLKLITMAIVKGEDLESCIRGIFDTHAGSIILYLKELKEDSITSPQFQMPVSKESLEFAKVFYEHKEDTLTVEQFYRYKMDSIRKAANGDKSALVVFTEYIRCIILANLKPAVMEVLDEYYKDEAEPIKQYFENEYEAILATPELIKQLLQ